jgi:hypothetical protein
MAILTVGYETVVRSKIGIDEYDLPDADLNDTRYPQVAEAVVKKRVPNWEEIDGPTELMFLEEATINYMCYLLIPGLVRRLNIEVKTLDTGWKKAKVDVSELQGYFLGMFEEALSFIEETSPDVKLVDVISPDIFTIGS